VIEGPVAAGQPTIDSAAGTAVVQSFTAGTAVVQSFTIS
jgi:hypothetical protein